MNTLNNAINDYLGYSYNLYKRLNTIYKDVPMVSVVVGNSQNSFYIRHKKYRTAYKIFGERNYFDCHKDSMLVKTLNNPFYFINDGDIVYQKIGYNVVHVSDWTSINTEDEVIADVAYWLHKLDGIEKRYLIEHICKENENDKLY